MNRVRQDRLINLEIKQLNVCDVITPGLLCSWLPVLVLFLCIDPILYLGTYLSIVQKTAKVHLRKSKLEHNLVIFLRLSLF